jgi:hypothetical protein
MVASAGAYLGGERSKPVRKLSDRAHVLDPEPCAVVIPARKVSTTHVHLCSFPNARTVPFSHLTS